MRDYLVQKAIDALDELGGEGPLVDRLSRVWRQLGAYSDDFWLGDSFHVKSAFRMAMSARGKGIDDEAVAVRSLITRILVESGYRKAVAGFKARPACPGCGSVGS